MLRRSRGGGVRVGALARKDHHADGVRVGALTQVVGRRDRHTGGVRVGALPRRALARKDHHALTRRRLLAEGYGLVCVTN